MGRRMAKISELDKGSYVIFNEEPCMVTKKSKSPVEDDGDDTKEKVYVEGLFDGQKRTFVESVDSEIEIPIVEQYDAEVLALIDNSAQLMDMETYETFEVTVPLELRGELEEGNKVEYTQALGRKKIERKKG